MKLPRRPVFIAADHAGVELKERLKKDLALEMVDLGPASAAPSVDYPDYADALALKIKAQGGWGILICGSGIGMSIRANRYPEIRAALCWETTLAKLAREHNDANVL